MIYKKEKYKDQFKIIDTEKKAYFLGFAYGDGCNTYSNGYKFTMASINTDKKVFEELVKEFPFFKMCTYPSYPKLVNLENYEKRLVTDIKNIGLGQNKMKQDKINNFNIPSIDEKLIHHFIRGFFDADGSVYKPTRYRSRNNIRVEFGLGTKNFTLDLKRILLKAGLNFTYTVRNKKCSNGKFYESHTLLSSSREKSLLFANYIYKDATIFSKRKKDIFSIYIKSKTQLIKDTYPSCPKCNNQEVIGSGTRGNKKRLKCKKCNSNFSVILPPILEKV